MAPSPRGILDPPLAGTGLFILSLNPRTDYHTNQRKVILFVCDGVMCLDSDVPKSLENLLCISHSVLSQAVLIFFSKLKNKAIQAKLQTLKVYKTTRLSKYVVLDRYMLNQACIFRWLSLHLNHLIASRTANYDWPFGTLPFGLFGSYLDTRDLETYPRTYSGHF